GSGSLINEAKMHGFTSFLHKPIRQSELFDEIVNIVSPANHDKKILDEQVYQPDKKYFSNIKVKTLLVEDNAVNTKLATAILSKFNCIVECAENGIEAIEKLSQNTYDIVFMDVQMPVMDGFTATSEIRSGKVGEHNKNIPIIAMTAHALKGDKEKCIQAGMNDYISKPISPDEIKRVIENFLKRKE
ncbi:MAG TPA: response regulator, partial [Victivallales bacterium]|nr:response regulator [Victivallales bacterium]